MSPGQISDFPNKPVIRVGQHIWVGEYEPSERNGKIIYIDYGAEEITAVFPGRGSEVFDFSDLAGCWSDRLGGYWHMKAR